MEQHKDHPSLQVVVIGANGGIGNQVVVKALTEGHRVTAIVRNPANLIITHPNLNIVQGDVMKPASIEEHLKNKDVVVSAIGKNSLKKTTLYSQGNRNIIVAMKNAGIKRAFFISASGLEVNPTHSLLVKFATKFILQAILKNMYADLWVMEKVVKESNINWTIIRPPKLIDSPETGIYRSSVDSYLNNGLKISRADVAHYIVHNLMNTSIYQKTIEIAY
jgi:putative NADH-flavin reductase